MTIDNTKAVVVYDEFESEPLISNEGDTQEVNETLKAKASAETENSEITYIKDTTEEYEAGETGRTMLKVRNQEGETMLIDKGRNKIIDTSSVDVQTEQEEYKVEVAQVPQVEEVKPVAAVSYSDSGDSSDDDEKDVDEDEENELFGKIETKEKKDLLGKDLGIIDEEDDDESKASTIKNVPKEDINKKKIEETNNKIKNILDKQVRMSQFNGRGPSTIRENSVINKISKIKNFDFLGLRNKDNKYYKRVIRILERYKEMPMGVQDGMECFTEYIYKIDTSYNKHKRKILITSHALYQLSKNFSVVYRVPLETIKAMTLIKKSASVIAIHCPGSFDHLIEIVRRTELVMFLMHMCDVRKLKKPTIHYADGLKTKTTKSNKPTENKVLKFDPSAKTDISKANVSLLSHLSGINFINSQKYGYLNKKAQGWFKDWSEKFCVITNIGLLYYNNPDQKPRNLFPIIDATIVPVEKSVYKKSYVFIIKSFKWEITFAAKTEQDYIEWMEAFATLQADTDKRKKALIETGILDKKLLENYKSSVNDK